MKIKLNPVTIGVWIALYGMERAALLASIVRFG